MARQKCRQERKGRQNAAGGLQPSTGTEPSHGIHAEEGGCPAHYRLQFRRVAVCSLFSFEGALFCELHVAVSLPRESPSENWALGRPADRKGGTWEVSRFSAQDTGVSKPVYCP